MNSVFEKVTTDFDYQLYQERQQYGISPENIEAQAMAFRCSDKFILDHGNWNIIDYKGFAVVSMVGNNPSNDRLLNFLDSSREFLSSKLNHPEAYYFLPRESYHQTIANTLSDKRYHENIVKKGIEPVYHEFIKKTFSSIALPLLQQPLKMTMIGVNIFGSCIAMLGIFDRVEDYNVIAGFRQQFYQSEPLNKLDIKWTRPFVGHITLAYLGRNLELNEKKLLADTINELNAFVPNELLFNLTKAELRKYNDLSCFQSNPEFPVFHFSK